MEKLLDRLNALEERVAKLEEEKLKSQEESDPAIKFYDPCDLWLNDRELGHYDSSILQDRLHHHNGLDFSSASPGTMSLLKSKMAEVDLSTIRQIIFSRDPAADSDALFRCFLEYPCTLRSLERIDIFRSNVSFNTLQLLVKSWFSGPLIRDQWIICHSKGFKLIRLEVEGFSGTLEEKNIITNLLSDPLSVAYRCDDCSPGSAGYLCLILK